MTLECNGNCAMFKDVIFTEGGVGGHNSKLALKNGGKRCQRCSYNICTDRLRCECCNGLFKTKTRPRLTEEQRKEKWMTLEST